MEMKTLKVILILLIVPHTLTVYAQLNVDKATKGIDRSLRKHAEEKLKITETELPEIEKEEKKDQEKKDLEFFLKTIKISGYESLPLETFRPLISEYENKTITLSDLNTLSKEIQKIYLAEGIIAVCLIPPQKMENKTISLLIVESKMGNLIIKDHKYFKKARINYYWKMSKGEVLRYDTLSRNLQLMNKNPDRITKATLHAGTTPKTTDVILDVETGFPIHLTSSFDNEGSGFTGKNKMGAGLRHNNLLGFDDYLIGGVVGGKSFDGIYGYHLIPLSSFGTSLLYGYSYSKSFPKKEYDVFLIDSRSRNSSIFLHQDLFDKEKYLGEVSIGMDFNDKTTRSGGTLLNYDRLRVLRSSISIIKKHSGKTYHLQSEISQGINGFGAKRRNSLSSRSARNTFTKLNTSIRHQRALPHNLQANLNLKSQISFSKLAPQEEFSLGGMDSVRGYPSGDFLADSAIQCNAELLMNAFFIPSSIKLPFQTKSLKSMITPLVFADYGFGMKRIISSNERKNASFLGAGFGVRVSLSQKTLLRLEWGYPINNASMTEKGSSRFHFSVDVETN